MEKILLPYFAAAVAARQLDESLRAFEPDRFVAQITKNFQIPARTAAEVQNSKRSRTVKTLQERIAILTDVVIAGAFPKVMRVGVVVV